MNTRRSFLKQSSLLALGLALGDEALELYQRLTHRRTLFAGWDSPTYEREIPLRWSRPWSSVTIEPKDPKDPTAGKGTRIVLDDGRFLEIYGEVTNVTRHASLLGPDKWVVTARWAKDPLVPHSEPHHVIVPVGSEASSKRSAQYLIRIRDTTLTAKSVSPRVRL